MKINMTTELGPFEGTPTVGDLLDVLVDLPSRAFVDITMWDSQHEGSGWRVRANWSEER
ncbi:hypothetical protein [Microbacterium sp. 3H14]|uniref:hypothetical protein n=1 Tax=Microbacterium sp. 3H14 TaxID=2555725 RepID=UPI00141A7564|nr:hypothetical protein [Microbacterium sp. 3H14]